LFHFSMQQSASSFVLPPSSSPQFCFFLKTIYKLMHEMDQKITHDTNLGIIIWARESLVLITRLSLLLLILYPWKTQNLKTHSSSLIRIRGIRSPNSNNEFQNFLWNFSTCHQPCLWIISYITYLHWFWEFTSYYYYSTWRVLTPLPKKSHLWYYDDAIKPI
jgi:hypothetical protein